MIESKPWAERLYTERERREWTQRQLAVRMAPAARGLRILRRLPEMSSLIRQIRRWERGEMLPDAAYQAILARCYGLTPREIFGEWAKLDVTKGVVVATGGNLDVPHFAQAEDDEMHRRKFAGWLMMLSGGAVALPPSVRRVLAVMDQPDLLPAITMHDVAKLRTTFQTLVNLEHEVGGAFVRRSSMALTQWALEQLEHEVSGTTEAKDAWKIMTARSAVTAGWSSHDAGRDQQARALLILGFKVGSMVEEDPSGDAHRLYSLIHLARHSAELGRPRTALATLQIAHGIAPEATPTSWCHLHGAMARAYAEMGDRERMLRELGVMERHFAQVGPEDIEREPWAWNYQSLGQFHYNLGTARYLLYRGGRTPLAEAELARQSFMDCVNAWDDSQIRTTTSARVRAATLMFQAREPGEGVALARGALADLPQLRSARIAEDVRYLRDAAQPQRRDPDVASLLDELAPAT